MSGRSRARSHCHSRSSPSRYGVVSAESLIRAQVNRVCPDYSSMLVRQHVGTRGGSLPAGLLAAVLNMFKTRTELCERVRPDTTPNASNAKNLRRTEDDGVLARHRRAGHRIQ
jgi:hypothetical protein